MRIHSEIMFGDSNAMDFRVKEACCLWHAFRTEMTILYIPKASALFPLIYLADYQYSS